MTGSVEEFVNHNHTPGKGHPNAGGSGAAMSRSVPVAKGKYKFRPVRNDYQRFDEREYYVSHRGMTIGTVGPTWEPSRFKDGDPVKAFAFNHDDGKRTGTGKTRGAAVDNAMREAKAATLPPPSPTDRVQSQVEIARARAAAVDRSGPVLNPQVEQTIKDLRHHYPNFLATSIEAFVNHNHTMGRGHANVGGSLLDRTLSPVAHTPKHFKNPQAHLQRLLKQHKTSIITSTEAQGNSRPVSRKEFQHLAAQGRAHLSAMRAASSPTTGLDARWEAIKSETYAKAQKSWGGATIDSHTGKEVPQGAKAFALTVKDRGANTVSIPEGASAAQFNTAMDRAKAKFGPILRRSGHHLGVFHDDSTHRIDIDPVIVTTDHAIVEQIGAASHSIGGAYNFADGKGYFPPHVVPDHNKGGRMSASSTERILEFVNHNHTPGRGHPSMARLTGWGKREDPANANSSRQPHKVGGLMISKRGVGASLRPTKGDWKRASTSSSTASRSVPGHPSLGGHDAHVGKEVAVGMRGGRSFDRAIAESQHYQLHRNEIGALPKREKRDLHRHILDIANAHERAQGYSGHSFAAVEIETFFNQNHGTGGKFASSPGGVVGGPPLTPLAQGVVKSTLAGVVAGRGYAYSKAHPPTLAKKKESEAVGPNTRGLKVGGKGGGKSGGKKAAAKSGGAAKTPRKESQWQREAAIKEALAKLHQKPKAANAGTAEKPKPLKTRTYPGHKAVAASGKSIGGRDPSLRWPHLFDILRAKGYDKGKAAAIANSRLKMRKSGKLRGLPKSKADNAKALAGVLKKEQAKGA